MGDILVGGKPLLIRPFSSKDQREARLLILSGLGDHFGTIDESLNPDLDDITAHYLTPGHAFVIADLSGVVVGTGGLIREAEGTGRLVRMSVKREYRRLGIGRKLVEHLLHLASQQKLGRILVETNRDWVDAIRLYQSHGFVAYAEDEESIYMALNLR